MTLWQAIMLGVVQGLTEFLPISSIAHMRLISAFWGWTEPGAAFSAAVQLIAYLAVLIYFWRDCAGMARGMTKGIATPEGKLGWMLIAGTIPISVLGLLFHKRIEHTWRTLPVIAWALIVLAVVLAFAEWMERRRKQRGQALREMGELGWTDAIVVGCFQVFALVPGASRSGSTITGGLFLGMKRDTAARFSFLLSLPAVAAAGIFELRKLQRSEILSVFVAGLAAFVVGYGVVVFLLGFLRRHTTWVFIIYRLALGAALLGLLAAGKLAP
ncbi:MAG: undecaprenyl-diphosphatase UppP [Verrucomicrobiia bacterium]|jgi:undecaprenyl-diphosphatase